MCYNIKPKTIYVTKKDGTWEMDPLSDEQEQKIHGMYRNER